MFSRTGIARGHHVFAQANSLAVAVINDAIALTAIGGHPFCPFGKAGREMYCQSLCAIDIGGKKQGEG